MFDFVGNITSKTFGVIGSLFLLIGTILSGTPSMQENFPVTQVDDEVVVIVEDIKDTEKEEFAPIGTVPSSSASTVQTPVITSTVPVTPYLINTPTIPGSGSVEMLQIFDVSQSVGKDRATIEWQTTIPARSRLILRHDDSVYESQNGIGTNHHVILHDLPTNRNYSYRITAQTLDVRALQDDLFGSFEFEKEYIVYLGEYNNEDRCYTLVVKDTIGNLAPNYDFTVEGSSPGNVARPLERLTTNSNGEAKYCYGLMTVWHLWGENLIKNKPQ